MTVELKIIRKVTSFHRGFGGIGTQDWEITLECGHILKHPTNHLQAMVFQEEFACHDCEQKFLREIEMYQIPTEAR